MSTWEGEKLEGFDHWHLPVKARSWCPFTECGLRNSFCPLPKWTRALGFPCGPARA